MNPLPIIAICGTTGVGKSNLAVELAVHLSRGLLSWKGAKIINADAMQVYRGMDIITNKIPESERRGIEHLLIGFKNPGEQYVIGQWIQDALKAIDETHRRNEVPIVVGGTSYWIQHLIFPGLLVSESNMPLAEPTVSTAGEGIFRPQSDILAHSISLLNVDLLGIFTNLPDQPPSASTDSDAAWKLYTLLTEVDPVIASRWHWRDTRKVLRSLQIIKETGRRASDIVAEQSRETSQGKPRFRPLIFWLYSEPSALAKRLDGRVEDMIGRGLLNEVRDLKRISTESAPPREEGPLLGSDYTLGIYQSIGYREFNEFLTSATPTEAAYRDAVERMRVSTRQYAKRQVSWIRNKLLPAVRKANAQVSNCAPAYLLDATEAGETWSSNVKQPAIQIMEDFLEERALPDPLTVSSRASTMLSTDNGTNDPTITFLGQKKIICSVCTPQPDRPFMVNDGVEWQAHTKSRSHRRLAARSKEKVFDQHGSSEIQTRINKTGCVGSETRSEALYVGC